MKNVIYYLCFCFVFSFSLTACDSDDDFSQKDIEKMARNLDGKWYDQKETTGIPGSTGEKENPESLKQVAGCLEFDNKREAYRHTSNILQGEWITITWSHGKTSWGMKAISFYLSDMYVNGPSPGFITHYDEQNLVITHCRGEEIINTYYSRNPEGNK